MESEKEMEQVEQAQAKEGEAALDPVQIALVEALIFAATEPIGFEELAAVAQIEIGELHAIMEVLTTKYIGESSGIELVRVASKFQFRTKAPFAPFIREMRAGMPRKLTGAALETLAIVAYRQPIVRSDIERIRGVDATPTLNTLIERNLIKIVGHQSTVGQPALFGTTDEFLKLFGLNSLAELPTLKDLRELETMPADPISNDHEGEQPADTIEAQQPVLS
ncbi:MAG: SMC-Scp complex subunit ScpB [Proteobacteria bacterium]|nr:MAG: SMC-Scp complex subunit ScpB [Pseudomonadota bacterium]